MIIKSLSAVLWVNLYCQVQNTKTIDKKIWRNILRLWLNYHQWKCSPSVKWSEVFQNLLKTAIYSSYIHIFFLELRRMGNKTCWYKHILSWHLYTLQPITNFVQQRLQKTMDQLKIVWTLLKDLHHTLLYRQNLGLLFLTANADRRAVSFTLAE